MNNEQRTMNNEHRVVEEKVMNKIKVLALGVFILALLACEQPFKAGLGPIVDIRPPTVTLTSPGAGNFIWSNKALFRGDAEDDYRLIKVELRVTNHPDINYYRDFTEVNLTLSKPNVGEWVCEFDTTMFPDGDLKVQVKVTDSVTKSAVTGEIAFYIKNQPPAISVSSPFITRVEPDRASTNPGAVGGLHLNYYVDSNGIGTDPSRLPSIDFQRRVDKGSFLSGSISDDEDIYVGEETGDRYPPQIRLWRVDRPENVDNETIFAPGDLPSLDKVPWVSFKMTGEDANLFALGVGNYQFAYSLPPDESGCFYGFEIRAQGINDENRTQLHYPRDYYPSGIEWDNLDNISTEDKWFRQENRYVLLYIITPQAIPTVDLIHMEDVLNPGSWNGSFYENIKVDGKELEEPHDYVDKYTVNKNGSFILRVRAEHTEEVESAEVYWEKEDGTQRGRFIWDLANVSPAGAINWDPENNVKADSPYSHWGYRDQNVYIDGFHTTRNYIYTYNHGGDNTLSSDDSIHSQVRGKSKIQRYTGAADEWQSGKRGGLWPTAPVMSNSWTEISELEEGVYNIEVYARSKSGTPMTTPFTCTIRIDRSPPVTEIINIDGVDSQSVNLPESSALVNGVIEVRMLFSDSLAVDTGLRSVKVTDRDNEDDEGYIPEDYYLRPESTDTNRLYGYEQRYILVTEGDRNAMDVLIAYNTNWWPNLPETRGGPLVLTGTGGTVTAVKHGPIFNSRFKFKTSSIYAYGDLGEEGALDDGVYYLYVFARDNAFNVGRITPCRIEVDKETDLPRFDFNIGEFVDSVKKADYSDQTASDGFWPSSGVQNLLRSGSSRSILIGISDDDSLDLGTATATDTDPGTTAIEITFTGSKSDDEGNVTPAKPIQFSQAQVKSTFDVLQERDANGRKPAQSRKLEISQSILLNLLQHDDNIDAYRYLFDSNELDNSVIRAKYTNLPDGIYQLAITIKDYSDGIRSKLKMEAGHGNPVEAEASTYFYFAVDSTPPRIIGEVSPKTNQFYSHKDLAEGVTATISDRNGPITVTYTVTDIDGNIIPQVGFRWVSDTSVSVDGIWENEFIAPVVIPEDESGTYNVTLLVKDRFNNTTTINQRYMIDTQPPTVSLRNGISTVDRSVFDDALLEENELPTADTIGEANLARLANGVVRFQINATDNFSVTELHWWLLPTGYGFTGTEASKGEDWIRYFDGATPANRVYRSLTGGFSSWQYINTTTGLLPDGAYTLYAMALDNSGNYSLPVSLQDIYIAQKSDIPFFGVISPSGGKDTVAGSAVIQGTIYEDDGFQNADGTIRNGSIRIWVSDDEVGRKIDIDNINENLDVVTPSFTGFTGPRTITNGLSRSGKDINLNVDLKTTNTNAFGTLFERDGMKHYIIEATDSAQEKYNADGTKASADVTITRRFYYSFTYDVNPPTIKITSPEDGESYSPANINDPDTGFTLVAWMDDANLDQVTVGGTNYYYFDFRLNTGEKTRYILNHLGDDVSKVGDTVTFTIPPANIIDYILTGEIPSGDSTLYLTAYDKTKKEATDLLKFIMDMTGPDVFLNETEVKLEDVNSGATTWWPVPTADYTNQGWFDTRRNLLDGKNVPVIQRKGTDTFITGTFVDELAGIQPAFEYVFDSTSIAKPLGREGIAVKNGEKSATWSVNISELSDGLHSIKLRAYDVNDNATVDDKIKMFAFRIIGEQPTVEMTGYIQGDATPTAIPASDTVIIGNEAGDLSKVLFTVKGTATSPNLTNVNLVIRHTESMRTTGYKSFNDTLVPARAATTVPAYLGAVTNVWTFTTSGTPVKVTENLEWSLKVTRDNLLVAGGNTTPDADALLAEGLYELALVSTDMYGLESEEALWSFTVDRTSPLVTFTSTSQLTGDDFGDNVSPYDVAARPSQEKTLTMAEPIIQARIQDNLSNIKAVMHQIRKWNYEYNNGAGNDPGRWEYFDFTGTGSWVAATSDACWQDAPYTSGMDSRLEWDLKATTGKTALVNLADGFYSIRYRAKDSSTIVGGSATAWTGTVNGNPDESGYLYFFYAFNTPFIEHDSDTKSFSSRSAVPLGIKVTDENRFNTLTVSVQNADGTLVDGVTVGNENGKPTRTNTWNPSISVPFPPNQADASYRIVYTVTNMAGRSASATRVIALDNKPPDGEIYEPNKVNDFKVENNVHTYENVSEIKIGGEEFKMNGTASDLNDIEEIWFHLGYGHNNTSKTDNVLAGSGTPGITQFPSKALVSGYFTDDTKGSTPEAGSAWFKYQNGAVPLPNFTAISGVTTNLLGWELEMDNAAIGKYVTGFAVTMNGATTTYTNPDDAGPWMVQPIHPELKEQKDRYGGLYSLPLWVRIVDKVGNVNYICRDIWLYPNGDYPSGIITNPIADTNEGSLRGGVIPFDGSATDNRSVRKVIYRVKADGYRSTGDNTDWATRDIDTTGTIVTLSNANRLDADNLDLESIQAIYGTAANGGEGATLANSGWYVVDLGGRAGDQSVPWDFTINADEEITKLISTLGFASTASGVRDTIRVRVEVFVFDDIDQKYNKVSLGVREELGDVLYGEPGTARPYVRVFYLKDSAPVITGQKISKPGSTVITNVVGDTSDDYTRGKVRGGQFAVQADLNGNGTIGAISVRLRGETKLDVTGASEINRRWLNVYGADSITVPGISITPATIGNTATLYWKFDTAASAPDSWHVHGGSWSAGGGTYSIDVRVADQGTPPGEASFTFELGVDNFAPLADNRSISITNSKVAGTNMSFIGRVFDYYTVGAQNTVTPTHRGIDKVYAWFTKDSSGTSGYINMNKRDDTLPATVTTDTMAVPVWKGRTATVTSGTGDTISSITYSAGTPVDGFTYPSPGTDYLKVLSAEENDPTKGITWQPTTVAGMDHDVEWNFITDTTVMPDGKMYLHYLVIDHVGNASYYWQEMVVMNNYPQITNVTLRTDNMGVGAIFTTHPGSIAEERYSIPTTPFTDGYLDSKFISKNQGIAFGVETIKGNGVLNYQVQYVQRIPITLTTANLTLMANKTYGTGNTIGNTNLYTIADKGNIDDVGWAQLGVPIVKTRPPAGTHFVFQGAAPASGAQDTTGEVWGYKVITTTATVGPPATTSVIIQTQVVKQANELNVSTTDSDAAKRLGFEGSNYFGVSGGRIEEDLNSSNDYFFLIKVWDSVTPLAPTATPPITEDDMLYDAVVVKMGVYLSDTTYPRARLYDLNPYTETAVIGNNINIGDTDNQYATIEVAADPTGIGENIKRGGLFNVKTERDPVKSGYIDPRSGTTALQPFIQNPVSEAWQTARVAADGYVSGSGDSKPVVATATRDKVSGRVILRGYAWDDQFVREIWITIGAGSPKEILHLTPVDADGKPVAEALAVGRKMLPVTNNGVLEPAFAYEELHWKDGHTVEWAYVWDTEKYGNAGGVYRDGVTITVEAVDRNGTATTPTIITGGLTSSIVTATPNLATSQAFNQITVDIVPYVVGFERQSIYANTRSRQGWYSFFQGETDIALLGYNLGTATNAPVIRYAIVDGNAQGTSMNSIAVDTDEDRFPFPRRYTFTVPDAAVSGRINVTATGGTGTSGEAYNHGSTGTNSWNKENYITGRELWNNKPHAHIWRTEQTDAPFTYFGDASTNDSVGISRPSMALEYNSTGGTNNTSGRLTGVWASYGNADSYYARNNGTRRMDGYNPGRGIYGRTQAATNITYTPGEPYLAQDVSFYNGALANGAVALTYEEDGNPVIEVYQGDGTSNQTHFSTRTQPVSTAQNGVSTQRWQNIRVVRADGRFHVSSYDSVNRRLQYYNSDRLTTNGIAIDGNGATNGIDGTGASNDAGRYSAIDYDGTGPIIAYYDTQNSTLRLAYASVQNPAANNWTRRNVMETTDPWYSGSGEYVSMKVTSNGNIHLAFYNNKEQTVVYAFATSRTATFTSYAVDRGIKGGTWTDISVDGNGNPMIVYGETARMGNYDGARMAYRSSGNNGIQFGTPGNMNAWEAVTMPSDSKVKNDRLNIEAWPPHNRPGGNTPTRATEWGTWNAAIGYAGEKTGSGVNTFRIGYFYYPGYKGY